MSRRHVEDEVVVREKLRGLAAATEQCTRAGVELVRVERFHDVVVGACVEAFDAVSHRVSRSQHQDRRRKSTCAHTSAQLHAAHARQAEIENHEVGNRPLDHHQRRSRVGHAFDAVPLGGKRALQHPADRRVVVDDEDRLAHPAHDSQWAPGFPKGVEPPEG